MGRRFIFLLFIGFVSSSVAGSFSSQARKPGEAWQQRRVLNKILRDLSPTMPPPVPSVPSMDAVSSAVNRTQLDLSAVTSWTDYNEIQKYFEKARDERFLSEGVDVPLRRSTWLYPDDGCYARAQLVEENLKQWGQPALKKVFVFGDLDVKSSNALTGDVNWWYHVAPIVSDGKDVYVLDPAINPRAPILFDEWLAKMGDVKTQTMVICDRDTYDPNTACLNPAGDDAVSALADQISYLDPERQRLKDLGRDDVKELGDFPPWLSASSPVAPN